jgi:hypothetical protein
LAVPPFALRSPHCRQCPQLTACVEKLGRYCLAVVDGPLIAVKDLPQDVLEKREVTLSPLETGSPDDTPLDARQKIGRETLIAALKSNRWEIAATARALGVARITLYRSIARFGFTPLALRPFSGVMNSPVQIRTSRGATVAPSLGAIFSF